MAFLRRNIEGGLVYEIDFTSLDSVSDLGEGAITINGVTWYSFNNGGTNKNQIVSGSGLRIYGNGSAGSNQSASIIGMDIGQLFGDVTYSTGFEAWVEIAYSGTITSWTTFTAMGLAVDNIPISDTNNNNMLAVLPNIAWAQSADGLRFYENWQTNSATTLVSDGSAAAKETPMVWCLRGAGTGFYAYYGSPVTAPAWPDKSSLTLLGSRTTGVSRTYDTTLFGPRFTASLDNGNYIEIRRMRILRVWSGN